jgi:hypothetical protein
MGADIDEGEPLTTGLESESLAQMLANDDDSGDEDNRYNRGPPQEKRDSRRQGDEIAFGVNRSDRIITSIGAGEMSAKAKETIEYLRKETSSTP